MVAVDEINAVGALYSAECLTGALHIGFLGFVVHEVACYNDDIGFEGADTLHLLGEFLSVEGNAEVRVRNQRYPQTVADVLIGVELIIRYIYVVCEEPARAEICRRHDKSDSSRYVVLGLFAAYLVDHRGDDVAEQPYYEQVYHHDSHRPYVDYRPRAAYGRGYDCCYAPREEAVLFAELFYEAESVESADDICRSHYRKQQYRAEYRQPHSHIIPR